MTDTEFLNIKRLLSVYKGFCSTSEETESWWLSLRDYSFQTVYKAAQNYIRDETRMPTPAGLLQKIPRATAIKFTGPKFETIDGKVIKTVQCQRCQDTGLVTWLNKDGQRVGKVCNCAAGHANYRWVWTPIEDQEAYVRKWGNHGEVIGEDWSDNWED